MKKEYSLTDILSVVFKRFWVIVLCMILCGAAAYGFTTTIIEKEYTSTVSMYVAPNRANTEVPPSWSDLSYAKEVINTYIEILKTNTFMKSVARTSGLSYSSEELQTLTTISVVNETEIFQVKVVTNNPKDSYIIADTIAKLAPQRLMEIKNADAVRVVDMASLPQKASSPNVMMNTAVGLALGVILGLVAAFFLDTLDTRVKNEEDLIRHYTVPILGNVPVFDE